MQKITTNFDIYKTMKKSSFEILTLLKENNNCEWFNENKSLYQDAKQDFEHLMD